MDLLGAVKLASTAVACDPTGNRYALTYLRLESKRVIGTDGVLLVAVLCEELNVPEPILMTVEQAEVYAVLPESCRQPFYNDVKARQPRASFPLFERLLHFPEPICTLYMDAGYLAKFLKAVSVETESVRLDVYGGSIAACPFPPIRMTIEDWDGGLRESPVVEMQAVMMPMQQKNVTPDGALGVHAGPIVQRWAMAIAESQRMWYGEPECSSVQNKDNISEL